MIELKVNKGQIERKLRKVKKGLKDTKPVMSDFTKREVKEAQTRIRTKKTDPDGNAWAPWSYATLQSRIRDGSASKGLLYKSGLLYRSFYTQVSTTAAKIGNTAKYAGFLQKGTSKMPARPFLGFGKDSEKWLVGRMKKFLKRISR